MDLMDLVAKRVKILHQGRWERDQVEIEENTDFSPKVSEETERIAIARFEERKAKNPKLFDGDAYHLDLTRSIFLPNHIFLAVGPMKYSLYDVAREEYAKKYGWTVLPTGMGNNAVIVTSDSKIVMHDRFPEIDHALKINVIGGVYNGGHPFDFIENEIAEEVGLDRNEIEKNLLIGFSNRLDERVNHEPTFLVELSVAAAEILKREVSLKKKEGRIFFLEKNEDSLREYLETNHQKMLSTGFSALIIAGRYFWGDDWSKIAN